MIKVSSPRFRLSRGMTVVEMVITTGIFSSVMVAVITALISLQTSFSATDDYFMGQGDQVRVMDYFSTDLRRALAKNLDSESVTYKGTTYTVDVPAAAKKYLTVVIPNYRDASGNARFPTIKSDDIAYGTAPVKVSYYLMGSSLYRIEVDPDLPATDSRNKPRSIADNVSDFNITDTVIVNPLITETVVSISATFAPKFNRARWTASLTSDTTSRKATTVGCKIQLRNLL